MSDTRCLAQVLSIRQLTLSLAESCSGGFAAHTLTNIPGSSLWFKGGVIAYANAVKTGLLQVPANLIRQHGAVSAPVAQAMAEGIRKRLKTDYSAALTGIAGPTGGTPQKPVGLVFIAISGPHGTHVAGYRFTGSRLAIKKQAAAQAIKDLLKLIQL